MIIWKSHDMPLIELDLILVSKTHFQDCINGLEIWCEHLPCWYLIFWKKFMNLATNDLRTALLSCTCQHAWDNFHLFLKPVKCIIRFESHCFRWYFGKLFEAIDCPPFLSWKNEYNVQKFLYATGNIFWLW